MTREIVLGSLCSPAVCELHWIWTLDAGKGRNSDDDRLFFPTKTRVGGRGRRRHNGMKERKLGRSSVQQGACQWRDIRSRSATVFWQQCIDVPSGRGRFWCHRRKRSQLDVKRGRRTMTSDDVAGSWLDSDDVGDRKHLRINTNEYSLCISQTISRRGRHATERIISSRQEQ